MNNCGDKKNPLQRGGTSQAQRLLAGLQKHYVNVDERDVADWIFFAAEFARYINYFNTQDVVAGNWTPFFNSDVSALLGSVAIQNVDEYRREIKERFDYLKDEAHAGATATVEKKLNELFSALLSFSQFLDEYVQKLPETLSLKNTVKNLIQQKLAPALYRLISYYKAADALHFLHKNDIAVWRVWNRQVIDAEEVLNGTGLSADWWTKSATGWNDYQSNIAAEESIFGDAAWTEYRRINHAAHHNLFTSIFDQYLSVYTKIVQEAEKELVKTLGDWDTHPAHYTLFLTFLKLFRFAQDSINTITRRHLDFYYKEVLRMAPKKAEPNQAHILAELAKPVQQYALQQGTLFKAGKDSEGTEVVYALDKEVAFNKAKVALLKSIYKGNEDGSDDHPLNDLPGAITVNNQGRLFAAPVANSEDGLGADLLSENKEWHPFVHKIYSEGTLKDIALPNAVIGFAVASHYLYLTEGERKVFIRLATSNNSLLNSKAIDCYLTTEKEWYKIEGNPVFSSGTMTDTTACTQLSFTLPGDAPAITNYNKEVHGGTLSVSTPVIKVYLQNEDSTVKYPYDALKDVTVNKIEIKVEVGVDSGYNQKGMKQLLLSNDFGPVDAAKPFQPFGPTPAIGNRLVIGNKEVFSKKNAAVQLNIEWKGLPASAVDIAYIAEPDGGNFPNVAIKYLEAGIWKDLLSYEEIFDYSGSSGVKATRAVPSSFTTLNSNTIVPYADAYTAFDISKNKGFIALQLTQEFGHKAYQDALTAYLIAEAKTPGSGTKPVEPYTPLIQSLYLSYTANVIESVDSAAKNVFDNRRIFFYHLYPFGEAEQHTYLSNSNVNLMPQFAHNDGGKVHHVGEFYIGIENLGPQQSVNILFQVLEGSTDPLLEKPDEHITWSYLSNNAWKELDKQSISDATRQLVQSGIISFVIPADATTNNTLLPPNYLWLRASVSEAAEAVCKLLSVEAQAAVVTFQPNNNADDFLDAALPADTISKLKQPDASVKKIQQPYPSFGGRPKEDEEHFYVRVSERLRHKARAITIWDYEHLVLEAFPQIHKVKCLNHTKIEEGIYNETQPGYVGIITVPSLVNRNDTNPLRPYTNQNTLLEIEEFLQKKISCHVKVRVRNPQFEEVRLSFALKLLKGFDDFTFYSKQLKEEITQFLTPWAYNSQVDIQFGGKIYKSTLINFIEERPYVDFITDVEMYHRIDEKSTVESGDQEEITASTARSILVSAPASKHFISEIIITEEEEEHTCIQLNAAGGKL